MSRIANKNNPRTDQIEEGELPDDQPIKTPPMTQPNIHHQREQSSPSSEIIFETVTDSELQSEKKKKKIYKQQKSKKSTVAPKEKERGYEKEKKLEKNVAPKFNQERQISPSFNYSNVTPPNNLLKAPNPYLPPQMQQFYPPPQFAYPMMPHPVPMPNLYSPYMGSYMHGNMPQPYPYNMGGMQMMQPNPMNQKPINHQMYTPQLNPQINSPITPQMNAQINPQMNNLMPGQMNGYNMNQKPKQPMNNPDFYGNQYKANNQGPRDWNGQKTQVKQPVQSSSFNQKQTQTQTQPENVKQRNRPSLDRHQKVERYQKAERHQKEQKMNEAAKKKALHDQYKTQLRKPLKIFGAQEQLEILQLIKCLTKQTRNQSKQTNGLSKRNHQKIVNELDAISRQSEEKRQSIYKILQILQFEWALMELKQKVVLNWVMKDKQFLRMSQLTKSILESPLKI